MADIVDIPDSYPKLFKKKTVKNGQDKMNCWEIRVDEDDKGNVFIVRNWGIEGGKITQRITEIKEGKNIGRSNETTKLQQAHKEAMAFWKSYIEKKEYVAARDIALKTVSNIPMTAYVLKDPAEIEGKEVYLQIKYDGVRALSNVDENGVLRIRSRTDREEYNVPHVAAEILPVLKTMGPGFHLDGELISDKYGLCDFAGALRNDVNGKTRSGNAVQDIINSLYYVVYDCYDHKQPGLKYVLRYAKISQYFGKMKNVQIVENYETSSAAEIKEFFNDAIANDEEGIMIRDPNCPYEHKRSKCLLKMKGVEESDYYVVDVIEADKEAGGILVLDNGSGEKFNVRPAGTIEERIEILERKNDVIKKKVTITYANLTDKNIPFHPRAKDVMLQVTSQ